MLKVCEYCEKEFETRDKRQKYCDRECYHKFIGFEKTIKVCEYCKKEFEAKKRNRRYCSSECYHKDVKAIRICGCCGKEFFANSNYQKYCSKKCFFNVPNNICQYCGKEFYSNGKKQKFCSEKCFFENLNKQKELGVFKFRKECAVCKKEFYSFRPTKKYCSEKCGEFVEVNRLKIILSPKAICECEYCGKEYERKQLNQMYCSKKCVRDSVKRNNLLTYIPSIKTLHKKNCKYCDTEFETDRPDIKFYCSKNCRDANTVYPTYTRICLCCGKKFETGKPNKRYCKNKCNKIHKAAIYSEKLKERREKTPTFCKNCGKEFTPNSRLKEIYCSKTCCDIYLNKKQSLRVKEILKQHKEKINKGEI